MKREGVRGSRVMFALRVCCFVGMRAAEGVFSRRFERANRHFRDKIDYKWVGLDRNIALDACNFRIRSITPENDHETTKYGTNLAIGQMGNSWILCSLG